MARHENEILPAFRRFHELKLKVLAAAKAELRLDDLKPRVLSSFVRNRLIDEVYLPLIGANFAKQIGTVGPDTRTDRSGLLLLISPPGYGKTTLIEYLASRLGLTLVKINAPALGHETTSLDPADAPNSAARQEIERLNLAFEMGDNVLLYLDDIQHSNPEFLQKFISLCDGTRRIEGVWRGQNRTWDLRGRRFAVVMAGNPYTEGGQLFKIPDMLTNRADTFNLGDILGGHQAAFESSYLENALTSNAALRAMASSGNHADIQVFIAMAQAALSAQATRRGGKKTGLDFPSDFPPPEQDFKGNYTPEEIRSMAAVTVRLLRVRDTLLRVNMEYIRSAGQSDTNRTEPPFKLQGSYRNMARITEKVESLMTRGELDTLIMDHYRGESQTLTTNAEANFLKLKELEGVMTPDETARWEEIKRLFLRQQVMGGAGDDSPASRVVGQLALMHQALETLQTASATATLSEATLAHLDKIITGLRAVPVQVDIRVLPVEESSGATTPAAGSDAVNIETQVEQKGVKGKKGKSEK